MIKKKIALCLFGTFFKYKDNNNKKKGSNIYYDPEILYQDILKNLIQKYDVDIFLHTWKNKYQFRLLKFIKPKNFLIEKPKKPKFSLLDFKLNYLDYFDDIHKLKESGKNPNRVYQDKIYRANSRWYSQCKSLELMLNYKLKKKINYKFVIQSRFDLKFNKKIDLDKLDTKLLHIVKYRKTNESRLNDIFFISNFKNSIKFMDIYRKLNEYPIDPPQLLKIFLKNNKIKFKETFSFKDIMIYRFHETFYKIKINKKISRKFYILAYNFFSKLYIFNKKLILKLEKKII